MFLPLSIKMIKSQFNYLVIIYEPGFPCYLGMCIFHLVRVADDYTDYRRTGNRYYTALDKAMKNCQQTSQVTGVEWQISPYEKLQSDGCSIQGLLSE